MYKLFYFAEPPASYQLAGAHGTVQSAIDWLHQRLRGRYIVFKNATIVGSPEHFVRFDQWVLADKAGNQVPLTFEGGKFVEGLAP